MLSNLGFFKSHDVPFRIIVCFSTFRGRHCWLAMSGTPAVSADTAFAIPETPPPTECVPRPTSIDELQVHLIAVPRKCSHVFTWTDKKLKSYRCRYLEGRET